MSEAAFPPAIAAALDRLAVPPLPDSFGDRLVARIDAGDLPSDEYTALPLLPGARRRFGTVGWRRSGRIIAVTAAFGIATATAAASGFFGEPVYVPVVSETLAKAQLVELPKRDSAKPKPIVKAEPTTSEAKAVPVETMPAAKGQQAVRDVYTRLRADAAFRRLPLRERTAIARRELQAMLDRGEVTVPELRAALQEHRAKQRERRQQQLQAAQQRSLPIPVPPQQRPAQVQPRPRAIIDPAKAEARREAFEQMPREQKARLRQLREQLRTAAPADRPAIRREIRSIWQSPGKPREAEIEMPVEGNPAIVR